MPELPEVETVVRELRSLALVGRAICGVRIRWPRIVEGASVPEFCRSLRGRRVVGLGRRGKYIRLRLDDGRELLIHLRMTGRLTLAKAGASFGKHEHLSLTLDDGRELRYGDSRKFGRWRLLADATAWLKRLGPEPLSRSFTLRGFLRRLASRRGLLKPLLLNQAFVAGLGNIYVDEALWEARLHPRCRAESLTSAEGRRLHAAIRRVLRRGIRNRGTSLGKASTNFRRVTGSRGLNQDRLRVFRRTGLPCPRCGTPISRLVVCQRGTHVCATCQGLAAHSPSCRAV